MQKKFFIFFVNGEVFFLDILFDRHSKNLTEFD